jgi:uncharacterized repeat protein (TIGR01451 family)
MRIATRHRCFLALIAALAVSSNVWAQAPQITSELQVQRVETVDGQSVYKPARVSRPGDILEYRVTYTNHGNAAINVLTANLPIPAGTTLVDRSQLPPDALASIDGSRFAPVPLMRTVRLPDGSTHQEPVALSEYRALRWNLGTLAPGKSAQAQARVSVNAPAATAAAASPGSTG